MISAASEAVEKNVSTNIFTHHSIAQLIFVLLVKFDGAVTLADLTGVNGTVTTIKNAQTTSAFFFPVRDDTLLPPGSQFRVSLKSVELHTGRPKTILILELYYAL